jgi:hypothetical protein
MKKIIAIMMSSSVIIMTGCTTTTQPKLEIVDKEPILVGKPVAQRIAESSKEINDQLELLNKIQSGGKIGNFAIVQHNNNLDARIGSENTIPQAYGKTNDGKTNEQVKKELVVKKIEWKNNSLNKLISNFAKAMGYQVVIKSSSIADKNVNFFVEKLTLTQSLDLLKNQVQDVANIIVIDKNKTINVFYK